MFFDSSKMANCIRIFFYYGKIDRVFLLLYNYEKNLVERAEKMGKKSIKNQKNYYQICREEAGMTRAMASEIMEFVSESRIVKIEGETSEPHPEEILAMASAYKKPELVNYYCSNMCPIGQIYVPKVKRKELSQIVIEVLASLNSLDERKNRLIEISADGKITDDELEDFAVIQEELEKISSTVNSLQLWVDKMMGEGLIDRDKLNEIRGKRKQ